MGVVKILDTLTNWAKENICNEILLKVPPENDEAMDSGYAYQTAHPEAFALYVPTGDKLPEGVHFQIPSLCVRFVSAQDDLSKDSGGMDVQIVFCTWNPGQHSQDVLVQKPDGSYSRQNGSAGEYKRTADGWRDLWNFVDLAVKKLQSVDSIGCVNIDKTVPFEYGPEKVDGAIVDFYPFWYAELSFRVNYPIMRNQEDYDEYL